MQSISYYLNNPRFLGLSLIRYFKWLPDKLYLQLLFPLKMQYKLDLNHPKTFQEKLQWLKLYNRRPEYTMMVDKAAVKAYVAKIIGDKYVIPTLGIWDRFDDIEFDKLPEKFVLKTTHGGGGGGVAICNDKSKFDIEKARKTINKSLNSDIYKTFREWPYKNVSKRIIAEKFIELPDNMELNDYKFFCFNGKVKFFKVDFGRFVEHHANYYDLDWNILPFGEIGLEPDFNHKILPPPCFEEMIEIAEKLSLGHKFIRVDLYNVAGKIYFGELTFFPASGLGPFTSREWDEKIGEYMTL